MARIMKTMDGNTAAAHVSYAFTEVAGIYPITPSSPMADCVDQWAAEGRKNIFGHVVKVMEMQSESGAAGTVHGSLNAGALTTTYTASQGLLLMIPNMYKMAGELLPAVFHVSARAIASHALSIFGDHSDVYACRQTGFAMLAEADPQEVMDLSVVAHLAAIRGRVPFLNFFDGFRTSHELQKIAVWDYAQLRDMCDMESVRAFRQRALSPEHPVMRGSHENGDTFFQNREASNGYFNALPEIVQQCMDQVNAQIGTDYRLFNYHGAPDAERVIVAMGSVCGAVEEVVDYLCTRGEKVGVVNVHLYRPFAADKLLEAIPETAKKIAVLDRTKEPGSQGEPLYMDVVTAFASAGRQASIIGGRYGLGSKDTPPKSVAAVFEELEKDAPKREFTISIVDDVTGLSLPEREIPDTAPQGTIQCKFWGLGGDGTVGANKNSIKIIGDHTDKYVQAYFQYDSKKTGGVTISHLRFGDAPIKSPYYINQADFVACHNPSYITKGFPVARDLKPGGVFLINCPWDFEELERQLSGESKRIIARRHIKLYTIDATHLAIQLGMGKRTNTILQSAFFVLADILPRSEAIRFMKDAATASYLKKGFDIVQMNHAAIDAGADALVEIPVPASWADAPDEPEAELSGARPELVSMVQKLLRPIERMDGDSLPVSAFLPHADGTFEQGASSYMKQGIAVNVPHWDADKCVQCNRCAYVCPHATIRPFALTAPEAAAAPAAAKITAIKAGKGKGSYSYTLAISPMDCMGCGVCESICPAKALTMVSRESQMEQQAVWDYALEHIEEKPDLQDQSVKGSQFCQPLLEFSGACAGCAETSYARLMTQLFGERMYVANATGCSSIWGGPAAASPYTVKKNGRGVAWANSLFEDNAEYGLGMLLGQKVMRDRLRENIWQLMGQEGVSQAFKAAAQRYLDSYHNGTENQKASDVLIPQLKRMADQGNALAGRIYSTRRYMTKKSVWIFGGDGWAYDIGFGGVDHVLASGEDINIFVFDTEVYSNTGGQASKASNIGQVAQFAAAGKELGKKSLTEIAMSYGNVYVAQVAMGADPNQTIKAICEAEAYRGPSLIVGYSPCEMHAIKGGMGNCQKEMKRAVDCGYWNLFRFDPSKERDPFSLDSAAPGTNEEYISFLLNEARYSSLARFFPERATELFDKSVTEARQRYAHLERLRDFHNRR